MHEKVLSLEFIFQKIILFVCIFLQYFITQDHKHGMF